MMTTASSMVGSVPPYQYSSHRLVDDNSSTSSACMTEDDEECIKSLLTLKHRNVGAESVFSKTNEGVVNREYHVAAGSATTASPSTLSASHTPRHATHHAPNPLIKREDRVERKERQSMSLAHPDDMYWLSDLQCYVRSFCTEFFSATEADVTGVPTSHGRSLKKPTSGPGSGGRRGPITLGRVGIRCVFCREAHPSTRASQATSFPSQISGIYGAVVMMQCRHFPHCKYMPNHVREKIAGLKRGGNSAPTHMVHMDRASHSGGTNGRQQYWADSARQLGLIDTDRGVRFKSEQLQLPSPSIVPKPHVSPDLAPSSSSPSMPSIALPTSIDHLVQQSNLVHLDDKDLVPDYLFLAMAQMKPCHLTEEDKVGCYKTRSIGFRGMCCKHCGGQPGFGKYFPATVRSLAQTTTSQTILKHIGTKCRMCPEEVRNAVNALLHEAHKEGAVPPTKPPPCKNSPEARPRYGSRKVFFQRVWGRLHGEHVPDLPAQPEEKPQEELSSMNSTYERASSSDDDTVTDSPHYDDTEDECESHHSHEFKHSIPSPYLHSPSRKKRRMYLQ